MGTYKSVMQNRRLGNLCGIETVVTAKFGVLILQAKNSKILLREERNRWYRQRYNI